MYALAQSIAFPGEFAHVRAHGTAFLGKFMHAIAQNTGCPGNICACDNSKYWISQAICACWIFKEFVHARAHGTGFRRVFAHEIAQCCISYEICACDSSKHCISQAVSQSPLDNRMTELSRYILSSVSQTDKQTRRDNPHKKTKQGAQGESENMHLALWGPGLEGHVWS